MSACCSSEPVAPSPNSSPGHAASCCGSEPVDHSPQWIRLGIAALVAAQSMAFGLAVNVTPPTGGERVFLHSLLAGSALLVFFVVGLPILLIAWRGLRAGRINMEQFFLLAIVGAFAASVQASLSGRGNLYYEVVAVLTAIYTLGRILGERRRTAAAEAVGRLRNEFDHCWKVTCCGNEKRLPVSEIQAGDNIRVHPGEGVPVDGIVTDGTAYVRETALTGETFPVVRRVGDPLLAGSIVEDGLLSVVTTQAGGSRRLDHLLRSLDLAGEKKAPLQREADRIVQWFLPAVLCAAAVTFIGWTFARDWQTALMHSLSVIVVACPCALGLATPLAIWGALNRLAERGVLVKSGDGLERLSKVSTVVFDKTGTLSGETPTVTDLVTAPDFDREMVRRVIASLQQGSLHPVARAFALWAGSPANGLPAVTVRDLPGLGIEGEIDGAVWRMGNDGIFPNETMAASARQLATTLHDTGGRTLYLMKDSAIVAAASVREKLRDTTLDAIAALRSMGLESRVMTGDPQWRNHAELGLDRDAISTGMRPEEKAARVADLTAGGEKVLFVGDGLNDAPAMRAAHASLALDGGAELSRETATGELFGGRMDLVPETIRLARNVVKAIHANMLFALCYNTIGIGLGMAGLLHPVVAAVIMLLSSVTVSWRALRPVALEESASPEAAVSHQTSEEVNLSALALRKSA